MPRSVIDETIKDEEAKQVLDELAPRPYGCSDQPGTGPSSGSPPEQESCGWENM